MPSRIRPRCARAIAALAVVACSSVAGFAQGTGNTTKARPDSTKTRPAPGTPADSANKPSPVTSADSARAPGAGADSLTAASTGVFTVEQAAKGKDVYLTNCVSCHTPADHTGGGFWTDLVGKRLSTFYKYLRENMPQDNAGAISDDDYASVVAYILQLNGLPAGAAPLPTDTLQLSKIRITQPDSTRKGP